jgi:glycosyltransferase involved in cell wall biosynthesis
MLVSVIVPIYKGKKYISRLIRIIEQNKKNLIGTSDIELIFINDYPAEIVSEEDIRSCLVDTKLIVNPQNFGIHKSRIVGLEKALGEYILFLDQDDIIKRDYIQKQLNKIRNKDIVVCNGIVKTPVYKKMLYKYWFMHITVKYLIFYTKFGCRIVSPGQCLIRKDCISKWWKTEIIRNNGSDDFFLWILLLSGKNKFVINRESLFEHIIHGDNTSNDDQKIINSMKEIIGILEKYKLVNKIHINLLKKQLTKEKSLLVRTIERLNKI